eukprot:TRINITY_DN19630_c0_g1_i2.p1 TRINITY_DN19630_c0_g1~~TRINITY_DN19630_c0_g1_i2.p1  ORF type:complete len:240 (-),score=69.16 TRINITY_DN19630_c0_g1_i2:59-778(-)
MEIVAILFALKVLHPCSVFLVRGNHEQRAVQRQYGFYDECTERISPSAWGEHVWETINDAFDWLPVAAMVGHPDCTRKDVLVVHGGIGGVRSVADIRAIPRPLSKPDRHSVAVHLLWSDPVEDSAEGLHHSSRGVSYKFGADVVKQFCEQEKLQFIVRGHEPVMLGYEAFAGELLFTVFSASNYCGNLGNEGALLEVGVDVCTGDLAATARPHYYDGMEMSVSERPATPPRTRPGTPVQ